MKLYKATAQDAPAIEHFLEGHAETSMFLRSNLSSQGIGASQAPWATDFWCHAPGGEVKAVFGATRRGYLMCQAPEADAAVFAAWAKELSGRRILGMTGVPEQVDLALAALGLSDAIYSLSQVEPLYALDLPVAAADVALRRPVAKDKTLLTDWFLTYEVETGLAAGQGNPEAARQRSEEAVTRASDVWLLEEDGEAIAMSGINARVAQLVQVGGVFVAKDKRNRGLGGKVVQAMLARQDGARRAILFANNKIAARAYERIGFELIGDYRIAMLAQPHEVGHA